MSHESVQSYRIDQSKSERFCQDALPLYWSLLSTSYSQVGSSHISAAPPNLALPYKNLNYTVCIRVVDKQINQFPNLEIAHDERKAVVIKHTGNARRTFRLLGRH
jgi:hypothetical protein